MTSTAPIRTPVDVEAERLAATHQAQYGRPIPAPLVRPLARGEVLAVMGRRLVAQAVRDWRGVGLVCLLLAAAPLAAQRPRWDLGRQTVDQFGPVEVRGPRIVFHALRAVGGVEAERALRALRVPPRVAAPAGALLAGVAPHVVGVARHAYPFDGADWAADAVIGGGSAFVAPRCQHLTRGCLRASAVYVAAALVAAGWASP